MKYWTAVAVLLAGCGTIELGRVNGPPGVTARDRQIDMLECKDQAHLAISTAANQTTDFLLGLTLIGYPAAYARDNAKQREVFATCMTAKGYTVTMPDGTVRDPANKGGGAPHR